MTTLATGFATAVQPVAASTVITTDTTGITAGEVKVPVKDGDMPAYRAMPENGKHLPIILVISEIWGVHEYIKDVCRRLAKAGYLAVSGELYARHGDVTKVSEIKDLLAIVSKASDAEVAADLDALVSWAAKNGGSADKVAITGFCWGGRVAWMYAAHNPKIKTGVAWYGPVARSYFAGDKTAIEVADRIKAPMLGLYGGADAGIPNETVEKMRAALKAAGNDKSEIVIYPDMPHAFHADYRPSYRESAAKDGWSKLLAWFRKNGVA